MIKTKFTKFLLFALVINLSMVTNIFAQSDPEEIIVKGKVLYSDQVTALKTPVPIIDVPQTLSIVTDEDIRKQGFRELGDIVRYTPGVNTSQGEGHRDSIVFRGVRSTADFYLDGVRDDVQYYRSLYNLEQVEILRGPNALLFGRGGTGGIINRVTKKAVLGDAFGSFDMGADTFGAFDFAVDYNVQTGENSALRINFHSDTLENHRDYYDGDRYGFNPTLRVQLSPQTTLDLSYEHADHERFIDRGVPTLNGEPVEAFEEIVFGDTDTNLTTLRADIYRANISHEFSDTQKGNFVIQYSDFAKMYKNYYASGYSGGNTFTADGYKDPTERTNLIISGNVVNEFQTGSVKHTLLVGAEIIDTENENFRYNTFFITTEDDNEVFNITRPINFGVNAAGVRTYNDFTADLKSKTASDIEVTSFYIQDQIDVSDNFKIMLGGRFDSFDITVRDIKNGTSETREDEEVSPRAGLIFKPQENLSLYVSYSESFLPRSGEQFKSLSSSSARLDPDVFESTEIGVKWDIRDNLSFTVSYFDSEQTQAVRDSDTGENSEIVGLQVDGIELELKGQVSDKLYLALGYSDLDGETGKGGEPREIPEQTASLWATYQVNDNFGLGFGITHQGESNIKNDKPGLILPDYTRVDFAAYYDISEDLSLQLNVENITDELYFPHSHSTHQASVGEPLNARFSLRRKF
ncbi:MAG: TonB-dependent siderophore receptor [Hyphomicrobiales bacterium]|jgi:catecholate siderophore receptor|nr:TonB-dependent siderophore receptor [Hyphomicrobiales bacterium]MDG1524382.1 TonB-dependent siderophore receptor [Hyphomicrobiales bacterium]MDG2413576.1 TonB-dependent siderophore receptor [Hyphomicrobiales bacterium]